MPKRRKSKQTGEGLGDIIKRIKDIWTGVRKVAPPALRKFTEQNGDAKISTIVVCRKPIISAIEKLASWVSGGRWDANKKSLQYDKMMHLWLVIGLDNGRKIKIEKNQVVEFSTNADTGNDFRDAPAPRSITWRAMLTAAESAAGGAEKLWVYDSITQNCQYFARAILKACGSWNAELEKFVMQDAAKVIEGMPWFQKVGRAITDAANVADVVMNGQGRFGMYPVAGGFVMQGAGLNADWGAIHGRGEEKKYKVCGRINP
jgi:hypothetical protein